MNDPKTTNEWTIATTDAMVAVRCSRGIALGAPTGRGITA